jgi:hypothetical protein
VFPALAATLKLLFQKDLFFLTFGKLNLSESITECVTLEKVDEVCQIMSAVLKPRALARGVVHCKIV